MERDPIEKLEQGWSREIPDLDVSVMATVARINRLAGLMKRRIDQRLIDEGSNLAEFDVLSALRRQGPPYELKPSELARAAMLSPSGMTHRIDMLEAAGLVERFVDPTSRRTSPVRLTSAGRKQSEQLARSVVETENQIMAGISDKDRKQLDRLTGSLLRTL